MDSKVAFAQHWYEKGVCPGCNSPLNLVAGVKKRHFRPGQTVRTRHGPLITAFGRCVDGSGIRLDDSRLCPWDADDLTSLVLLATKIGERIEQNR
jgi:hypothetical protein